MPNHRPLALVPLLAISLFLSAPCAQAAATLALTWDSCTGPVDRVSSGPGSYALYASVVGVDAPHKAYELWLTIGDSHNLVPDAWRFDPSGCQGLAYATIEYLPPRNEAAACPAFQGSVSNGQFKLVDLWPLGYDVPPGMLRLVLSNIYPDQTQIPDPNQRYFLARFVFDHTYSVEGAGTPGANCGGFETPMIVRDVIGGYQGTDGVEVPFVGSGTVTARFLGNGSTPAHPATWGAIKSQYR